MTRPAPAEGVDVLARIDREISCCASLSADAYYIQALAEWRAVRAAVAELIAADREYDAARKAWMDGAPEGIGERDTRPEDDASYLRLDRASSRRAAALARCSMGEG